MNKENGEEIKDQTLVYIIACLELLSVIVSRAVTNCAI